MPTPVLIALLVFAVLLFLFALPLAGLMCSFEESRELPHASPDECSKLLESLRDRPEEWSGASDNPYIQAKGDFKYEVRHLSSGVFLWIANGWPFFKISQPEQKYIPLRWRLPMWWYFLKNRPLMQQTNAPLTTSQGDDLDNSQAV